LNEGNYLLNTVYENRNDKITNYIYNIVIYNYEFIKHGNAKKVNSMVKIKNKCRKKRKNYLW